VKDEGLKHAYEDADKHNWTKSELDAYDYVLMREQDERGRISFATRKGIEKAVKIAVEKAVKIAVEKAVKLAEEKAIDKNGKAVAFNLIKLGFSIKDTSKATGLTIEQVRNLQTEK
jgi:uncharacterized protein YjaZ